jgi:hypothetical protein
MTSLVLQFNEAAVAAMEGNTRLRVLMKSAAVRNTWVCGRATASVARTCN